MLLRTEGARHLDIVALLEPHGEHDGAREYTIGSHGEVARLQRFEDQGKDLVLVETGDGASLAVALAYDPDPNRVHDMRTPVGHYRWRGFTGSSGPTRRNG